jgi:peptide/nickel transport system ATP-binding protein
LSEIVSNPLLLVRDLTIHYRADDGTRIPAVEGVDFEISPGEVMGLVGESGSGKSTIALALLGLLPTTASFINGSIIFRGRQLSNLHESAFQEIRGAEISMIFQESGLALNPVMRVGEQVCEVIRAHRNWNRQQCRKEVERVLEKVRLPGGERIFNAYPHQLSGGERQRVMIAQGIACEPALLIADEPTASLDAITQREILDLLKELKVHERMAILLITHNPAILTNLAERVVVQYAGRILEEGEIAHVFQRPLHPYTQALLDCVREVPAHDEMRGKTRLPTIPGNPPNLAENSTGCAFEPRCAKRFEICKTKEPKAVELDFLRRVSCLIYGS